MARLIADKVIIPAMAEGSCRALAAAFRAVGVDADITQPSDQRTLDIGARHTSGDECLPAIVTIGDFIKALERPDIDPARTILFMPLADGPCRFGQYAPYLRNVLAGNGYRQVRIVSATCSDGYDGLNGLPGPFTRTVWRAALGADILEKLRLMTRPYEVCPGDTDSAYSESLSEWCRVVESSPLGAGRQMRALRDTLYRFRDRFRSIGTRRGEPRPLIGVVGEIYCRLNPFSNQDLVRRLEEYGAEAWLAGFCEWVWYVNAEERRILILRGHRFSPRALGAWVRQRIQHSDERALYEPFQQDFAGREDPSIEEILEAAKPYLPPDGAMGEMVLNAGNVPCLARRGVCGVIDISPFTCMNGIVSEAIYPRISADLGGLPVRNLYFDGSLTDFESDIGVFLEMARAYRDRPSQQKAPLSERQGDACAIHF